MEHKLYIYNTLSHKKEQFIPLHENKVGMYVCGPTVYGDAHLGHARPAITFDILFRYLMHLGYKVRYVRNITDVGHLENDADSGEDKIEKKARLEELEPMEVVQLYTNRYHKAMEALNVLPPSIEPHASGHIIEQIEVAKKIFNKKLAYKASDNSIYFDVLAYNEKFKDKNIQYGILSGRDVKDIITNTRELAGQEYKHNSFDFALLKKADKSHIMKWGVYPYSNVFPGWHLECTAMSTKYLGKQFDIHGGGLDLMFPHHECEIAQGVAVNGVIPAKYWVHNNMITINGQKMGKSLGNFINLEEFFTGDHPFLTKAFSPMTVRFFILRAKYNSTLDFSDEGLKIAEKKLEYLLDTYDRINKLEYSSISDSFGRDMKTLSEKCEDAMNDDLNTPLVISYLDEAASTINSVFHGKSKLTKEDMQFAKPLFDLYLFDLLGICKEVKIGNDKSTTSISKVIEILLDLRQKAKQEKNWSQADEIREKLKAIGIDIFDTKDGKYDWIDKELVK